MEYWIEVVDDVKRKINNLDYPLKEQILKAIQSLKYNSHRKGKCIGSGKSEIVFYEKEKINQRKQIHTFLFI